MQRTRRTSHPPELNLRQVQDPAAVTVDPSRRGDSAAGVTLDSEWTEAIGVVNRTADVVGAVDVDPDNHELASQLLTAVCAVHNPQVPERLRLEDAQDVDLSAWVLLVV